MSLKIPMSKLRAFLYICLLKCSLHFLFLNFLSSITKILDVVFNRYTFLFLSFSLSLSFLPIITFDNVSYTPSVTYYLFQSSLFSVLVSFGQAPKNNLELSLVQTFSAHFLFSHSNIFKNVSTFDVTCIRRL